MDRQPIEFKFWPGDDVRSERGECGTVVGASVQFNRTRNGLECSYRVDVGDPAWRETKMIWVPERALSLIDG